MPTEHDRYEPEEEQQTDAQLLNEILRQPTQNVTRFRELDPEFCGPPTPRPETNAQTFTEVLRQAAQQPETDDRDRWNEASTTPQAATHQDLFNAYTGPVPRLTDDGFPHAPRLVEVDTAELEQRVAAFGTGTAQITPDGIVPLTEHIQRQLEPEPEPEIPLIGTFCIQQDVTQQRIRELADTYPPAIHRYDYQQPVTARLNSSDRSNVRSAIRGIRQTRAAMKLYRSADNQNDRRFLIDAADMLLSSEVLAIMQDSELPNADFSEFVRERQRVIRNFFRYKNEYIADRKHYGPVQARYYQQAAAIRQQPSMPIEIDLDTIARTLIQWPHVFGIAVRVTDDRVFFRVGLCNIEMEESAEVTQYDDPVTIPLAPFYFTLELTNRGRFHCPSPDYNARGLARPGDTDTPGELSWTIHPHQLSDTPCFGNFGQTLIDAAQTGDVTTLVSTIIAFYSQYNSRDSAGVSAREYHPEFVIPFDPMEYSEKLRDDIIDYTPYSFVNDEKLYAATFDFVSEADSPTSDAPRRINLNTCDFCECEMDDEDPNDVCDDCRAEHYCDCGRVPADDCDCESEDDAFEGA